MAGMTPNASMRDVPDYENQIQSESPISEVDKYYRSLEGRRGNLNPADPNHREYIANILSSIENGLASKTSVDILAKNNPTLSPLLYKSYDSFEKSKRSVEAVGQFFNPGTPASSEQMGPPNEQGQYGVKEIPAVPAQNNYQGAIATAMKSGNFDLATKLAAQQKASREGAGKGMYGGIRVGIIPGTKKLIEYGVDEATGQVKEVGTGKVLTRGVDYEPTVGVTNMPVIGGGIQSFPNRGGIGEVLPNTPTGAVAMPTEAEAKGVGQGNNANQMGARLAELVRTDKVKVGPVAGRALTGSTVTGVKLSDEEAEFASLEENYSNSLLQAMRGAQVGPLEQEMFNKSLPRRNQPEKVFLENVRTTLGNIQRLNSAQQKIRAVPQLESAPTTPTQPAKGGFSKEEIMKEIQRRRAEGKL